MANQEVQDFWGKIVDQYGRAIRESRPDIQIVGAIQGNTYQTYERGATLNPDSEKMLRIYPSDIQVGDRVFIITGSDGGKYVGGKIFETGDTEPVPVVPPPFNYPYSQIATVNSATVASTSDTSNYSQNVGIASFTLPTGTWTVTAWGWGMYSHSSANGIVRVRMLINANQGTALTMACPVSPARVGIAIINQATGQSGTISISMDYRPNSSGTASAGGGTLAAFAVRTA